MNSIRRIKNNLFVRNCGSLVLRIQRFFMRKSNFAQCPDSVIITPPHFYIKSKEYFSWR